MDEPDLNSCNNCYTPLVKNNKGIESHIPRTETLIDQILMYADGEVDDGWEFMFEKKGVIAHRLPVDDSPVDVLRGQTRIHCNINDLATMLLNVHHTGYFDDMFLYFHRVEPRFWQKRLNRSFEMLRYVFKAPWPVTNRDFCFFAICAKLENDVIVDVIDSVSHDAVPEQPSLVRGNVTGTGYVCRPVIDDDGNEVVDVTYVVQLDPKGSVPSFAVKFISRNQPLNLAKMKKFMENGNYSKLKTTNLKNNKMPKSWTLKHYNYGSSEE